MGNLANESEIKKHMENDIILGKWIDAFTESERIKGPEEGSGPAGVRGRRIYILRKVPENTMCHDCQKRTGDFGSSETLGQYRFFSADQLWYVMTLGTMGLQTNGGQTTVCQPPEAWGPQSSLIPARSEGQ